MAVVSADPITNSDVSAAVAHHTGRPAQRQSLPPQDELRRRVLERLINERSCRWQPTGCAHRGRCWDATEQAIARQNQITVAQLRERVAQDGMTPARFRRQLRDQLILQQRLHEREVEARMRITDADIDRYLAEQQGAVNDPAAQEVNLAHLLIAVPRKQVPTGGPAAPVGGNLGVSRARNRFWRSGAGGLGGGPQQTAARWACAAPTAILLCLCRPRRRWTWAVSDDGAIRRGLSPY